MHVAYSSTALGSACSHKLRATHIPSPTAVRSLGRELSVDAGSGRTRRRQHGLQFALRCVSEPRRAAILCRPHACLRAIVVWGRLRVGASLASVAAARFKSDRVMRLACRGKVEPSSAISEAPWRGPCRGARKWSGKIDAGGPSHLRHLTHGANATLRCEPHACVTVGGGLKRCHRRRRPLVAQVRRLGRRRRHPRAGTSVASR